MLGSKHAEAYLHLQLGFAAAYVNDIGDDFAPGWMIGLSPGLQIFLTDNVGILMEVGWQRHVLKFKFKDEFDDFKATSSSAKASPSSAWYSRFNAQSSSKAA